MELTMMVIGIVSMVATVISTVISIKARNKAKTILSEIKSIEIRFSNQNQNVKNKGKIDIDNSGTNDGIMAGNVAGGIHTGGK